MSKKLKDLIATRFARAFRAPAPDALEALSVKPPSPRKQLLNVHTSLITSHFQGRVAFEGDGPVVPQGLLLLAFTNRSGSNLLADYLQQTKHVGGLGEYLNHTTTITQSSNHDLRSFPDYILHLAGTVARDRQYFGVKTSAEQLRFLRRWRITEMFSSVRVVHIHRDDLLGQAVSHWIARQTGQWTSLQERDRDEVSFNPAKILSITKEIAAEDEAIRLHCAYAGLSYVSVSYEELIANRAATMTRIGAAAGFEVDPASFSAPRIGKQANELNDRILADLRRHIAEHASDKAPGGLIGG